MLLLESISLVSASFFDFLCTFMVLLCVTMIPECCTWQLACLNFLADNLTCNLAKSLPEEIDVARMRRWDAVLVNQYLCELREAKKQGRKERRHKEAQAVLAAATAAAASSSRISSFRKDAFDETSQEVSNFLHLNYFLHCRIIYLFVCFIYIYSLLCRMG